MIEIRKSLPSDAEGILECCRRVGGETDNLTFGAEGIPFTVEQERAYLESILQSNNQLYLVAVVDGEIVGTGVYSGFSKPRLAHRGEISLSVRKAHWGRHIGTRLLEELLRFAREEAKAELVSLEVRSDNPRAIGLYKKFGFVTVGTFPGYMKIVGQDVSCDTMVQHL